jgi:neutral ceramidase
MFRLLLWAACFGLLPLTTLVAEEATSRLNAGAAAIDITPQQYPLNMPGGFSANMAESAHDSLHARALVLQSGGTTLAMVVVDNLGLAPEVLDEAKALAAQKTNIPAENMLICATHTHSAPPANTKEGSEPAVAYRKRLIAGMAAAIVQAHTRLSPAALGVASHDVPEEVFNRRWFLKPGKMPLNPFGELDAVKMNPGTSSDILERPAGPTDPELMILSVQNERREPLALWANYPLHYVGGIPPAQVSADYFGEFARIVPARLRAGTNFVAMMSNGASGDINNIPFNTTRPPREPFEQVRIVAQKAADAAWFAHRKIEKHQAEIKLAMLQRELPLKYRRPTQEQIAAARKVLAVTDPEEIAKLPNLAPHYARNVIRFAERSEEEVVVKLQAIRIGDLAVCAIPFETLVEIGLDIKARSPFPRTMIIGLANGRHGYLPNLKQHRLGGYETWLGTNEVQEGSAEKITEQLLEMLTELKQKT